METLRKIMDRLKIKLPAGAKRSKAFRGEAEAIAKSVDDHRDLPVGTFDNSAISYEVPYLGSNTIERSNRATIGNRFPAASRNERPVNILSAQEIEELIAVYIATGLLLPVEVGWRGHRPEDKIKGWMATTIGVQGKVPATTRAYWAVVGHRFPSADLGLDPETGTAKGQFKGPDEKVVEVTINLGHLLWRWTHRTRDGRLRLLPTFGDVSHQAEAYHKGDVWVWVLGELKATRPGVDAEKEGGGKGYQIQIVNLESHAWNELRKQCAKFGLSVRWGEGPKKGQLYQSGEEPYYVDAMGVRRMDTSMCPHALFGVPCYAPLPGMQEPQILARTAETPEPSARQLIGSPVKSPADLLGGFRGLRAARALSPAPPSPGEAGPSLSPEMVIEEEPMLIPEDPDEMLPQTEQFKPDPVPRSSNWDVDGIQEPPTDQVQLMHPDVFSRSKKRRLGMSGSRIR
jgi:hypothetical protein